LIVRAVRERRDEKRRASAARRPDWRLEAGDGPVATVESDRIVSRWEASEDLGKTWRKDFDLIFERRADVAPHT
jgi:hypothetical protein